MATKKAKGNDASLPFAALQLLAPPVRLVSAALWKVIKQRDVMQYGVVEEFVTSACETVPGLLTVRHQGKLALGLRARFILELCRTQPDEQVIMPHLERVRPPSALSTSSAHAMTRYVKLVKTVESFHSLVHTLLTDPAERELFFQEEFPVDYSPEFDQELEKLLWEFLIRLDQLLPVPDLAQTVSWLSDTPAVLEECARAATQPQLLKVLLQHQTCLGHLENAASLPPNMGDSILASLSLQPSGRASSRRPATSEPLDSPEARNKSAFITPVIGLISNDDVPVLKKRRGHGEDVTEKRQEGRREQEDDEASKRRSSVKRQQPERSDSEVEEGEEAIGAITSGQKTPNTQSVLCLPRDPALCSVFMSCLNNQPRVVVEKVSVSSPSSAGTVRGGRSFYGEPNQRRKLQVKAPTHKRRCERTQKPVLDYPGLSDKENHPVPSCSPTLHRHNSETSAPPGGGEDYVADSEDEATKNFKGRLFMKRYYKTKHGTYIPTLREFWKPGMTWRDRSAAGNKRR